jgi:hypothetical protein
MRRRVLRVVFVPHDELHNAHAILRPTGAQPNVATAAVRGTEGGCVSSSYIWFIVGLDIGHDVREGRVVYMRRMVVRRVCM